MTLPEKITAVEAVFVELDAAIQSFQDRSTLYCKWGCGKCCFYPEVEATPLEFLPFAYTMYKSDRAFEWLEKLKGEISTVCTILNEAQPGAGLCSEYVTRGLICRLFGYSARTNKYGKKEMVTCQIIKSEQADAYQKAEKEVGEGSPIPVMSEYYSKLQAIDFELTRTFYPINQAIRKALEEVLHYYAYRE